MAPAQLRRRTIWSHFRVVWARVDYKTEPRLCDSSATGSIDMRGHRYDRILAGTTAVALVLAAATGADAASTKNTVAHKPIKVSTPVRDPLPDPKPIEAMIPAEAPSPPTTAAAATDTAPVKAETAPP